VSKSQEYWEKSLIYTRFLLETVAGCPRGMAGVCGAALPLLARLIVSCQETEMARHILAACAGLFSRQM